MGINIGIIGLSKSGRTTVFNALTKMQADTTSRSPEGLIHHMGVTKVPEPRLALLADIIRPHKLVPAEISYMDIGVSVTDLVKGKTIAGQLLTELRNVDALINVSRAFTDDSVPHMQGNIDTERDIDAINLELTFSDLALLERRIERIETSLKGARQIELQNLLREQELVHKLKNELERDIPIREMELTAQEIKLIANYQLLTAKPLLIIVNSGEGQLCEASQFEMILQSRYSRPRCRLITFCSKLEMEFTQLDDDTVDDLRVEFGMTESGVDRVIQETYRLLGLVTFFTIVSGEAKAWPIQNGTEALKAAGKIHTDMEKGFIRAEVINIDDLTKCGGIIEARNKGLLRLEGKNYKIQDGDVITFLFNV